MKLTDTYGIAGNSTLRRGLTGLVGSVFLASIMVLVLDVKPQLLRLATASSDNVQWVLAQAETEAISLELTVSQNNLSDSPNLSDVRLQFDIFFSRIDTLANSPVYTDLRVQADVADSLALLRVFLDRWVPVIDGPDDVLAARLSDLADEAREARRVTRRAALSGIELFSKLSDQSRDSVSDTLLRIALLTIALVAVLLLLVGMLMRQSKIRATKSRENRVTRERMETILSSSLDAVIVTNGDGIVTDYNGAAERVFGYPREQAIGTDMAELIIPDHFRPMHDAGMKRYRKHGDARVIGKGVVQLEARRANGDVFPVDLSLATATSPDGDIFVGFIRDISDRVKAENELKQARDRAIAGEKSKAELLAVMSHEMRTPLNGMLGTLELFDSTDLDARRRRYLRIIRNSGNVLLGHVNDVLDISRLDAGKMSLSNRQFDLIALLEEIIEEQSGRARENGNVILLTPPSPRLHEVYSDPVRLRQVILNLVGNAIKFTRNGRITIEAECQRGLEQVEIRVIDNGVGISESDLTRIFGDFVTIDATYGRSNTGTGLGLGISQRLATALGGELGAESELGDGSLFWLRLPMHPPEGVVPVQTEQEINSHTQDEDLPPLNILMVEDNAINRMVAREMLERLNHTVTEAHNGKEGLALAERNAFDLILMDISMPEMDGITATRLIRAGTGECTDIPIIATTAHALPDEVRAFREAGMSDVLVKPLSIRAVRKTLFTAMMDSPELLLSSSAEDEDDEDEDMEDDPLIDHERLTELLEDLPRAQLRAALTTFSQEMTAFLTAMPEMVKNPDRHAELSAEAHRMAGSAGVFGAARLTQRMRRLQYAAQSETDATLLTLHAEAQHIWAGTLTELQKTPAMSISGLTNGN